MWKLCKIKLFLSIGAFLAGTAALAWASGGGPGMSSGEALKLLAEGNARHVSGKPQNPHRDGERRAVTASKGQQPFATVLACSDSRVPVELLFDRGIGDLFVVRVAGNVAGVSEIGSMEYAVDHLGTPLLVVLGHSKCGAVTAVAQNQQLPGSLPDLAALIKPAVEPLRAEQLDKHLGAGFIDLCIKANVWQTMAHLFAKSQIIRDRAKNGSVKVLGALYDLDTGKVEWLGPHPAQALLLGPAPSAPKTAEAASKH
jgi:carbonic anhydrase